MLVSVLRSISGESCCFLFKLWPTTLFSPKAALPSFISFLPQGCGTPLPTIEKPGPVGGAVPPVGEASGSQSVLSQPACPTAPRPSCHASALTAGACYPGGWRTCHHTWPQRGAVQKQLPHVSPRAGKVPEETSSTVQKVKSELQFPEILLSAAWDGKQNESHWDVLVHLCPSDSVLLSTLPFVFPTQRAAVDF